MFLLQFCIHRNSLYRVISNQIEEKILKSYLPFNNFTKFSNRLRICIIKEELNKPAYLNVTNEYEPPCRITTWKILIWSRLSAKGRWFFHNIYASRSAAFAKFHEFSREKVSNSTFLLLKPFGTGSQLAFKDFKN